MYSHAMAPSIQNNFHDLLTRFHIYKQGGNKVGGERGRGGGDIHKLSGKSIFLSIDA